MYSFEGDFRRKPQQNLAGASAQRKTDRDALLLQTQQQRQKREVSYKTWIILYPITYKFLTRNQLTEHSKLFPYWFIVVS